MADLREMLESAGLKNVTTYIQSGNLVFDSAKKSDQLEALVCKTIEKEYGYQVPTMVRSVTFFNKLYANNPFEGKDIKTLCATILSDKPKKSLVTAIAEFKSGNDEFVVNKDVVYLYIPDGYSKTKLTNGFLEKKLEVKATTRNWKTVGTLVEMAGG